MKETRRAKEQEWKAEFARRLSARMDILEIDMTSLSKLTGINLTSISNYANGINTPRASVIPILAKALALDVSDLIDF